MMWEHTGGWGMGWVGIGLVHMLVFWGVIVFVIFALVKLLAGSPRENDEHRRPLDILKERYARGDIDQAEYERMRRELSKEHDSSQRETPDSR